MDYLKKLPGQRALPGLEWQILKRLPMCALGATVVPALLALSGRLLLTERAGADAAKQIMTLDIFSIAICVMLWTAIITIAVGCVVVVVMKGPAYVADGYSPDDPKYRDET